MKQFVRYLYEHENGKRIRNVGFVKVEKEEDTCVIHIHGKGLRLKPQTNMELYVFYLDGKEPVGIWQGEIQNVNPAINYRLEFTPEDVGGAEKFEAIAGIILTTDSQPRYAATWKDSTADIENMVREERRENFTEPTPAGETEVPSMDSAASGGPGNDRSAAEPMEQEVAAAETNEPSEPAEAAEPMEPVEAAEVTEMVEAAEGTDTVETDQPVEAAEAVEAMGQTAAPEKKSQYNLRKITREQIAELPRREWRLANNSFLLHGYYNYHHLLLVEDGDHLFLGIPGVYHDREKVAAEAFGFDQFMNCPNEGIELTEKERGPDQFGYWCRQVMRHSV